MSRKSETHFIARTTFSFPTIHRPISTFPLVLFIGTKTAILKICLPSSTVLRWPPKSPRRGVIYHSVTCRLLKRKDFRFLVGGIGPMTIQLRRKAHFQIPQINQKPIMSLMFRKSRQGALLEYCRTISAFQVVVRQNCLVVEILMMMISPNDNTDA